MTIKWARELGDINSCRRFLVDGVDLRVFQLCCCKGDKDLALLSNHQSSAWFSVSPGTPQPQQCLFNCVSWIILRRFLLGDSVLAHRRFSHKYIRFSLRWFLTFKFSVVPPNDENDECIMYKVNPWSFILLNGHTDGLWNEELPKDAFETRFLLFSDVEEGICKNIQIVFLYLHSARWLWTGVRNFWKRNWFSNSFHEISSLLALSVLSKDRWDFYIDLTTSRTRQPLHVI